LTDANMDMTKVLSQSFRATELEARTSVNAVVQGLCALGLQRAKSDDIQIALAEAINNVVEHAYPDDPTGLISIQCRMNAQRVDIEVHDAGVPFANGRPPRGANPNLSGPVEHLPEGGFGWLLIRSLAQDIFYDRHCGANALTLRFELTEGGD
jgi:serine/threonine-protein kinase RsbW